jgi:hypothetical protein
MKHWILFGLLCIRSFAFAADAAGSGCDHVALILDPRLTPAVVEQRWASGELSSEVPANLELRGCNGELLDQLPLDAPLARLDNVALRGTEVRTYLVTMDLTAPAGSYSGPLTVPVQVIKHKLKRAEATTADRRIEPIKLPLTGKAAWKKVANGATDDLLSVSCQPQASGFTTTFRRYHPTRRGWQVRLRSEPILWESDGEFPKAGRFPRFAQ